MKKMKYLLAAAAAGLFLLGAQGAASAAEITVDVTAAKDFRTAVQSALNEAASSATDGNPVTVKVPAGTYEQDAYLYIGSNTTLDLTGVTIKRTAATNAIRVGKSESKEDGVTGYAYRNIKIKGGTIDGGGIAQTVVKATHCKNFSLSDVTLTNTRDGHLMEVAGVDGLTLTGCTFSDQEVTASEKTKTYEAVQLDILCGQHMQGTRSEALATKQVKVKNCTFEDVPRGIGSHTAILNVPLDQIEISGCTFKNMKSCAIQSQNWINVSIHDNTITGGPRGIAVYFVRDNGQGTYLPSVLAAEGNTQTDAKDAYIPNDKQNIKIYDNKITLADQLDPYASIARCAIVANGCEVDGTYASSDGSGGLPAGNYYISQVSIQNNQIVTYGNGIRIVDGRNCTVSGNTVTCKKASKASASDKNCYGIQARELCEAVAITKNKVSNATTNGIYVSENSKAKEIANNTVSGSGKYGIDVEKSTADKIAGNKITKTKVNGIYIYNKASVKTISGNTVKTTGKYGIDVENAKVMSMTKNKISGTKNNGIFIYQKSSCTTISKNSVTGAGNHGISVNTKSKAGTVTGNTIKNCKAYGITFGAASKGTKVSGNKISGCKSGKVGVAKDSSVKTVKL